MAETENMTGVMFPHDKTNEKQPDYKGRVMIGNVEYYVACWEKVGKMSGTLYMKLIFQTKEERAQKVKRAPEQEVKQVAQAVGGKEEINPTQNNDEDVPF